MDLKKIEVYRCPKGVYEESLDRAIAWHIVELSRAETASVRKMDFSDALTVVRLRDKIIPMLLRVDQK